jgi:tetratricopeptide (TPR) repeat protein
MQSTAAAAAVVLCILWNSALGARNAKTDVWKTKESLMLRLSAEWAKIAMLQRESASIADVLATMRDIELYPQSITGYDDEKLLKFDKSIETLEKTGRQIDERIADFKAPLADAIAIFRELVVGEPVESMFATLEQANLQRIGQMLDVKHQLDTLWQRTDTLLTTTMRSMGAAPETKSAGPADDDFFQLLRANLGMQADGYYVRLNKLKDHLMKKATAAQVAEMARIERNHIIDYLTEGKSTLAERKTTDAIDRFVTMGDVSDFYMLQARIRFEAGAYRDAKAILDKLPPGGATGRLRMLYRMQSLFALHEFDSIMADTVRNDLLLLEGGDLNLALWIITESALALKKPALVDRFVGLMEKGKPYALHLMHALARSYLAQGDDTTALSILEKARTLKVTTSDDRMALQEITISIAQLQYEMRNYDKAIELFYQQINDERLFERALTGIAWCYLQSGRYDKAETALRKLINQSPESAPGVEGILILARRYLQIASFAWKKHTYITKEKDRLARIISRLDQLSVPGRSQDKNAEIATARKEVKALLDRINGEQLPGYNDIAGYYEKIGSLCSFISTHYYTGTYQENIFSRNRERMLHIIDSVTLEIGRSKQNGPAGSGMISNVWAGRMRIRRTVDNASVFSAITLIDRYRWEREYIDWRKGELKRNAPLAKDSSARGKVDALNSPAMDSLIAREDSLQRFYAGLLKTRITSLLGTSLDKSDECYLKYQLAELQYRSENDAYAAAYEKYDQQATEYRSALERFRSGAQVEMPREVPPPVLRHDESIRLYREALAADSSSRFGGASHYGLAWCYNDIARFDSAFTHMNFVATHYPDHPYAAQAWMFCGEYYFDRGDLKNALPAFYAVMKYPESEWFDEALYKVAWTQYRLSNPEKAISSFLALVDLGGAKFGRSLLEKESMDYIAISFSETDASGQKGLDRAAAFARKLNDAERGCQILHRLGQVFRDQGRYDMATKTFSHILSSYPAFTGNPSVEAELLTVLERDSSTGFSIDRKYDYFKKYCSTGAWAKLQPDSVRIKADSTSRKMLYDAAISYHQFALQKNNDSLYRMAISAYTDFIGHYPLATQANECHYNLAEIQFSLGNYRSAAEEYIAVSRRYPDSKYKETAAWNAIVASQNLLKLEQPKR